MESASATVNKGQSATSTWWNRHSIASATTTVALIAIGSATLGVLALLASMRVLPFGLGALSQLPQPVSILLIAIGGLGLSGSTALGVWRVCFKKEPVPTPPEKTYTSTPKTKKEEKAEVAEPIDFSALSHQELLSLKLQTITKLDDTHFLLLRQRLSEYEKADPKPQYLWSKFTKDTITLGDFRKIKGNEAPEDFFKFKDDRLFCFLTITQILEILGPKSEWVLSIPFTSTLLPLDQPFALKRAKYCLNSLSQHTLSTHIEHFSGAHLRLLRLEHLQANWFPWSRVAQSKIQVEELLPSGEKDPLWIALPEEVQKKVRNGGHLPQAKI